MKQFSARELAVWFLFLQRAPLAARGRGHVGGVGEGKERAETQGWGATGLSWSGASGTGAVQVEPFVACKPSGQSGVQAGGGRASRETPRVGGPAPGGEYWSRLGLEMHTQDTKGHDQAGNLHLLNRGYSSLFKSQLL